MDKDAFEEALAELTRQPEEPWFIRSRWSPGHWVTAFAFHTLDRDTHPYTRRNWYWMCVAVASLFLAFFCKIAFHSHGGWRGWFYVGSELVIGLWAGSGVAISMTRQMVYSRGWRDGRREMETAIREAIQRGMDPREALILQQVKTWERPFV